MGNRVWTWFQGKKTYFAAGLTVLLAGVGLGLGQVTDAQAIQLVSFAALGLGLGDKLQRYLPEIVAGLNGLASVTADLKQGNTRKAIADAEEAAVQLGPGLVAKGVLPK